MTPTGYLRAYIDADRQDWGDLERSIDAVLAEVATIDRLTTQLAATQYEAARLRTQREKHFERTTELEAEVARHHDLGRTWMQKWAAVTLERDQARADLATLRAAVDQLMRTECDDDVWRVFANSVLSPFLTKPVDDRACTSSPVDDSETADAVGKPEAEGKAEPIHLHMEPPAEQYFTWKRRWQALRSLNYGNTNFVDRDGRWTLADFFAYAGEVCGFDERYVAEWRQSVVSPTKPEADPLVEAWKDMYPGDPTPEWAAGNLRQKLAARGGRVVFDQPDTPSERIMSDKDRENPVEGAHPTQPEGEDALVEETYAKLKRAWLAADYAEAADFVDEDNEAKAILRKALASRGLVRGEGVER